MSRISAESFLSLITQSGLVESDRLKREVDDLEDQGHNVTEAAALADSLIERDLLTEWQAEKLLKGKHKGFSLGKYRLRRLLGKGGMSSVYLAEHILMRRQCAIKVLPIKRVNDTSYLARFHREARAVASLDHPNIVRAYDIDHEVEGEKEIHFLVMEYVDGESLHDLIKDKGPLSLDDTAEYFRQAALGLDNAHKNGLIHRDVKPGNLLVDKTEVVKVLDLGLARFSEISEDNPLTLTHDEKVLGTADYLAPEQAMDSHTADHRADIYGLGCTAYFALTGYPPFRDGTLAQRLMFHQTKDPPAMAEERPEIGNTPRGVALEKLVRRMMAKKPDERFQTMDEVAAALAHWLKIYATAQWRSAHPDAFLKSDAGTSGGTVPVAKAVAVQVAKAIDSAAAETATRIGSGSDTLLQNAGTQSPDAPEFSAAPPISVTADPVVTAVPHAEAPEHDLAPPQDAFAPPVETQPLEPAATDDGADDGLGAFLAGFDGGAEAATPAFPPPESPADFTPEAVAPEVEVPADPATPGPVAVEPVDPEFETAEAPAPASVAVPEAAPAEPNGIAVAQAVVSPPIVPAAPVEVATAIAVEPVDVDPATVEPSPAEQIPVEPESAPAAELTMSAPIESAPVESAPDATSDSDAESVDVASVEPHRNDLEAWGVEPSSAEPLADFDSSILPDLSAEEDEYPSLLGGTPTGPAFPGFDDPSELTQSEMEKTGPFVPATALPVEPSPDATTLNAVENSSEANVDLVPAAFPTATAAVPPAGIPIEAPPVEAPVFAQPAAQQPIAPAASETPMFPATAEAPMFPGIDSGAAPVFEPPVADAAPGFTQPAQSFDPAAQPGFAVEQPFAPQAQPTFPTEAPAFGAPPAGAPGQYAAPGQMPAAAPTSSTAGKKPPIAIIAGVVVALAVGAGAYFAFTGGDEGKAKSKKTASGSRSSSKAKGSTSGSTKSTKAGTGRGKILGPLVKVGPGGDFSTIAAALDYLKQNKGRYDTGSRRTSCKVEVAAGETYNEAIVVDNSKKVYPPGIQLVSAGVGRAKLAPSGSGPAIRLIGIEHFGIHGFDVDASGKDVAIEMSGPGYLSRTSLNDLTVSGFTKVGILMNGAVGFSNDEIILDKIDLRGSGSATAGIHFTSGDNGTGRIKVLNCRLFGPQETGMLFETDVNSVEIRESIIAAAGIGISFNGGPLTLKDVQVLNTTFYKCSRGGIVISHMPPAGGLAGSGGMALHRNLFAQVNGPELKIENEFDDKKFDQVFSAAGGGVEQNWSDRKQPADIKAGEREIVGREAQRLPSIEFSTTDDNSEDFLSLKPGAPYSRVGGAKLETKPYIGARPAK